MPADLCPDLDPHLVIVELLAQGADPRVDPVGDGLLVVGQPDSHLARFVDSGIAAVDTAVLRRARVAAVHMGAVVEVAGAAGARAVGGEHVDEQAREGLAVRLGGPYRGLRRAARHDRLRRQAQFQAHGPGPGDFQGAGQQQRHVLPGHRRPGIEAARLLRSDDPQRSRHTDGFSGVAGHVPEVVEGVLGRVGQRHVGELEQAQQELRHLRPLHALVGSEPLRRHSLDDSQQLEVGHRLTAVVVHRAQVVERH